MQLRADFLHFTEKADSRNGAAHYTLSRNFSTQYFPPWYHLTGFMSWKCHIDVGGIPQQNAQSGRVNGSDGKRHHIPKPRDSHPLQSNLPMTFLNTTSKPQ